MTEFVKGKIALLVSDTNTMSYVVVVKEVMRRGVGPTVTVRHHGKHYDFSLSVDDNRWRCRERSMRAWRLVPSSHQNEGEL